MTYQIQPPELVSQNPEQPIEVPEEPRSLDQEAQAIFQESLKKSQQFLTEGHDRQPVQELLWLLETVSTAFQGLETGSGTVQGKYFNKPNWARDASFASGTINAKSETAAEKPAFRDPFKYRRCLIPADGFYEWTRNNGSKQPFCFEVSDGELFAFAGLWDGWKNANGQWIKTCSILTTIPNAVTAPVHNRMPVILDPAHYDLWLDPGMQNVAVISELLKPYDARFMRCYPVSTRLNHVANDDEECSRPVEVVKVQSTFFH